MQETVHLLNIWAFLFFIIIVFVGYIEYLFGKKRNKFRGYTRMELRNGRRPASRGWDKYR